MIQFNFSCRPSKFESTRIHSKNYARTIVLFTFNNNFVSHSLIDSDLMSTTESPKEASTLRTPPTSSNNITINNQFRNFSSPDQLQPQTLSYMSRATALEAGKITATSTHFELEQPNCVQSLITMSCRGRAEAFARSLQTKLRNLGQVREK